jgi:pimeloyl-ACP methyl ester carboxylesterase
VSRREFIVAGTAALVATALPPSEVHAQPSIAPAGLAEVTGTEHWTVKRAGADNVKLFMWRKRLTNPSAASARRGTILFVHGSSVSATPVFDLRIPGKPEASAMDGSRAWARHLVCRLRATGTPMVAARERRCACGADDLAVASEYIMAQNGGQPLLMYGASSGALRAGLFAQRQPHRVQRLALDALVWTGEGSPTLAERKKRLAQYQASNRRPIDRAFVQSIFTRDHPGTSDLTVVDAFADAVLALDTSMPNGTYIDMSANLPVLDPKKIAVPTLIMRGEYDGIASFRTSPTSLRCCPTPTSSSSSCLGSRIPARARKTGRSSITCSTASANRPRSTSAENTARDQIAVMPWLRLDGLSGRRRSAMIDAYPLVGDGWRSPLARRPGVKFCSIWVDHPDGSASWMSRLPRMVPIAAATAHCAACCRLLDNERSRHV